MNKTVLLDRFIPGISQNNFDFLPASSSDSEYVQMLRKTLDPDVGTILRYSYRADRSLKTRSQGATEELCKEMFDQIAQKPSPDLLWKPPVFVKVLNARGCNQNIFRQPVSMNERHVSVDLNGAIYLHAFFDQKTSKLSYEKALPADSLSLNPSSTYLSVDSGGFSEVCDIASGKVVFKKKQNLALTSHWKDERQWTAGCVLGKVVRCDIREKKPLFSLRAAEADICGVAHNFAGSYFAVSDIEGNVAVFDERQEQKKLASYRHQDAVKAIAFIGRNCLASGGMGKDKMVYLFDVARIKELFSAQETAPVVGVVYKKGVVLTVVCDQKNLHQMHLWQVLPEGLLRKADTVDIFHQDAAQDRSILETASSASLTDGQICLLDSAERLTFFRMDPRSSSKAKKPSSLLDFDIKDVSSLR